MKRRATKPTTQFKGESSRFSKLLFNKSEKLVQNLKARKDDANFGDDLERKPAWVDEDDVKFGANIIPNIKSKELYVDKLKQKYETLMGTPSWAKIHKKTKTEHDGDDELLRTVGHLHKEKNKNALGSKTIQLRRFPKINGLTSNEGAVISCVEFHPKSSVALVAGSTGIVSLFSVGGDINEKLHSFKLQKWKIISTADFAPSGNVAYISSKNYSHFCVYDLIKAEPQLVQLPQNLKQVEDFKLSPDGKYIAICDGYDEAFIICAGSKELLRILKHNSPITSFTFSHDSKQLYSYGCQGEVTIWDLSTYRSVKKFYDSGCVTASCICTSSCGRLLATGSGEGIVNVYQTANLNIAEPLPHKTISNLTTKISNIKFNPTTEILAISSSMYPDAAKLVHIPSFHVFMNFPEQGKGVQLGNVNVINFSPNSGFMGLGNNKGCALLYRLKYYKNY